MTESVVCEPSRCRSRCARRSPSQSALPAAGGCVRRRRASAVSRVSCRGLRSSLRLYLCPPLRFPPPTSQAPACPGHARCYCKNKRTPRRRQRHLRLRRLLAPGPRRRLQGVRLALLGGFGPAPPRRRRAQARLSHSGSRRVSGGELGEGARPLVPGWGAGRPPNSD